MTLRPLLHIGLTGGGESVGSDQEIRPLPSTPYKRHTSRRDPTP